MQNLRDISFRFSLCLDPGLFLFLYDINPNHNYMFLRFR